MKDIQLTKRAIGLEQPVYIIAEAGVNHNGDLGVAIELVDVAAAAGADAVKFQTFNAKDIIVRTAPKAKYHIETTGSDMQQSWFELLQSQQLDRKMHEALILHCQKRNIEFLSTPYDKSSVDLLHELGVELFKVASTDANNVPFLEYIAGKGKPMIVSTAMTSMNELKLSIDAIRSMGINDVVIMQCTGSYPAPAEEANLRAMNSIAEEFNVIVGYSDHVPGTNVAIAATALGASVYEKHFTLDRKLPGPDHRASLEPDELKNLVLNIRETESALGDGIKRVMPCEMDNRLKLRKFIVANKDINKGETFSTENITTKRTGGVGLEPRILNDIAGRCASVDIIEDEVIKQEQVVGLKLDS